MYLFLSCLLLSLSVCCLRMLSLELILHILQSCGPAFKSGDRFIFAIRNYLCVSLLSNCTSQIPPVIGLSLHIFVALLNGFKSHLKSELEVFVTNIFLRILESENSTFDHKSQVLEVFQTICKDSDMLVRNHSSTALPPYIISLSHLFVSYLQMELFINYDCDFEAIDLFRRIIDAFSKISKVLLLSLKHDIILVVFDRTL
jgi:brefeldin A-inhibited guanine nucleotide-exchange protein